MSMVAFDTLAYSKRLQEAGVPSAQAEAHAIAQADFLTHYLLSEVATKTDLAEVKAELKTEIAELKTELKTEIAGIKTDMAEMETRLTMRMLFMVGILATLMTVFKFIG